MFKSFLKTSFIALIGLFIAFFIGFVMIQDSHAGTNIQAALSHYFWILLFFRWFVYIGLLVFWKSVIHGLQKRGRFSSEMAEVFIEARWKFFLLFIVFDLLVICNGIGRMASFL